MLGAAAATSLSPCPPPGTWSSRLLQPTYSLGELINVKASVGADPRLPLRVFVAECVASPSVTARLDDKVIADDG